MTVLRVEVRQFNKQTFMDSISVDDKPFYEKVRSRGVAATDRLAACKKGCCQETHL